MILVGKEGIVFRKHHLGGSGRVGNALFLDFGGGDIKYSPDDHLLKHSFMFCALFLCAIYFPIQN